MSNSGSSPAPSSTMGGSQRPAKSPHTMRRPTSTRAPFRLTSALIGTARGASMLRLLIRGGGVSVSALVVAGLVAR